MIEVIAYILVGLGLMAGAFIFARRPSFWIEFGWRIGRALLPHITKRMSPEEEAEWHKAIRRGQGDEWLKARMRRKRKG